MARAEERPTQLSNISSVHESIPQPQSAPYSASKGGMEMLTKTVTLEVADKGIRVNGIAPGAIATDMNKDIHNIDTDISYSFLMGYN